jgi:type I restriction enzyme S subunit
LSGGISSNDLSKGDEVQRELETRRNLEGAGLSYPQYPKYKDSGVAWLGEVPEHWNKGRLRWLSRIYSGGTPDKTNQDYWTNGTIPWLNSGAVNQCMISEPSDFISQEAYENSSTQWINPGSLLIALAGQGKTKGMVAQLAIEATCNQSMAAIVPENEITPRFLFWWLTSNYQNIRNISGGDLRDGLNLELIGNIQCPLPESKEQTIISSFLDQETSRIDTLISEKVRLISLLQEYRQALISHAVTKGLDPNVKMKDSGVEWLGKVPEHWVMSNIKHIVSTPVTDGPHETPEFLDQGIPFVSAEAISTGIIDFEKVRGFISIEDHRRYSLKYSPKLHDIYMVKSGATTGVTAIVETDTKFNIWSPLAVIRCSPMGNPYFILNVIRSRNFQEAVALNWSYGTQQNIGMGTIENLAIPIPPFKEQTAIVSFLNQETSRIDTLISEARKFIDLLKVYRSSLITAVVTGKIDVREVVPSGSEKREIAHE